jgi:hypothetical protein
MSGYFKARRRKCGLVVLALALVLLAGWMRSQGHDDTVECAISLGESVKQTLESVNGYVIWSAVSGDRPQRFLRFRSSEFDSYFIEAHIDSAKTGWLHVWTGIGIGYNCMLIIPYWYFIIPLTTLAALLLLGSPRAVKTPSTGHHS